MAKIKPFSAMLAETPTGDMEELKVSSNYPFLASFKLDGIRGISKNGEIVSRSAKRLPSAYVQQAFAGKELEGLDGEMVIRNPHLYPGEVYKQTFSAVMTHGAMTPVEWYVFDYCAFPDQLYDQRHNDLINMLKNYGQADIHLIEQKLCWNYEELLAYEKLALDAGYEGLIVRRRDAPYKYGRSTLPQEWMLKMVRVALSEFVITGCYEGLENTNTPIIDARGYTTRSKHIAQMVGKNSLGGFFGYDLNSGVKFKIGGAEGLDHDTRRYVWEHQSEFIGKISRYKYKPYGTDKAPRQPIMLWGQWRDIIDL